MSGVPVLPDVAAVRCERHEAGGDGEDRRASAWPGIVGFAPPAAWFRRRAFREARFCRRRADALGGFDDAALAAQLRAHRRGLAGARGRDRRRREREVLACAIEAVRRCLGIDLHPVQIAAARLLADGVFVEMATGEGKSLTAVVTAILAAVRGEPVHVLTANDHLARRDAAAARPILDLLGLSVAAVDPRLDDDGRRRAYAADVVFAAGRDVAFDYLRDRLEIGTAGEARLRAAGLGGRDRRRRLRQRGLGFCLCDEADSVMIDEARTPLVLSRDLEDGFDDDVCAAALALADGLVADEDFTLDRAHGRVELTAAGEARLAEWSGDLEPPLDLAPQRRHLVATALRARHLFGRDEHYLVVDGAVHIIDEYTGRTQPDRAWSNGLHQLIEAKEGLTVSAPRVPLLRITWQRFVARYHRLAGMSGTLAEARGELARVYGARVVALPTHHSDRRRRLKARLHRDEAAKIDAVVAEARSVADVGRAVLVGARTVRLAERIHAALAAAGSEAALLSAARADDEAAVIAAAGSAGRITVATNMAGRGTDIPLDEACRAAGGLHVICAEHHDSARIDRQLTGRAARQGDPGSFRPHMSLEDPLAPRGIAAVAGVPVGPVAAAFRRRQRRLERRHAAARARLLRSTRRLEDMLAFAGEDV